jgi:branched-chain amino acid transport system ATP-binding protein
VARGLARTFQINQLFATMTPLEMIALVDLAASKAAAQPAGGARSAATKAGIIAETAEATAASSFHLDRRGVDQRTKTFALRQAADCSRSPIALAAKPAACCCSTSLRPACPRPSGARFAGDRDRRRCRPRSRCC